MNIYWKANINHNSNITSVAVQNSKLIVGFNGILKGDWVTYGYMHYKRFKVADVFEDGSFGISINGKYPLNNIVSPISVKLFKKGRKHHFVNKHI